MTIEKIESQIAKTREKLKRLEAQAKQIRDREALADAQKFAAAAKRAGVDLSSLSADDIARKLAVSSGESGSEKSQEAV